jgi:hypothetical protein
MPDATSWSRARVLAALLVAPVLLFGPMLAAGQVFLPFLPVCDEPLAGENPAAAAEARRAIHAPTGDRVYPFLVDQLSARAELRAGHLPTWEPLQTLGMPLFGGNVAALGYPPNWLAFLIPPERAAAPLALLALFLAGFGTWLFLARLGLDPRAALLGALGVELGGFGLANLHYYMKVDSALWLPWALWAVEGLARGRRWSASALVGALALSFLGGMVSIAVFVLAATGLYALVRLGPWALGPRTEGERERSLVPLLRAGLLCALGVAGSAYWLWPVREAAAASLRGEQPGAVLVAGSLPPASALGVLVPDLAGTPDDPTPSSSLPLAWWLTPASLAERAENANVLEWNVHALVALALLALVGAVADPRRAAFPGLLLLACFAFAQGWPVVRWLYAVPGLGLGAPQRVLALAWILWPWLAALGIASLITRAPRALPALLAAAFVTALGLLQAWRWLEPGAWASELAATILARYPGHDLAEVEARLPLGGRLAAGHHLQESLARGGCAAFALFLAGLAALLTDRHGARFERGPHLATLAAGLLVPVAAALLPFALSESFAARGPQALLGLSGVVALTALAARSEPRALPLWLPFAALVLVEGFLGSFRYVQGRAPLTPELFPPSPTIEAIREAAGDGRVLRLDPTGNLSDSLRLARPNMLIPYGIADLTPYPTFTPRQAAELAGRIDARMVMRNHVAPLPALELVEHPLLDLLRAQCVLSTAPLQHARLAPLIERPGFCIYRRLGALPPARIVPRARAVASDEEALASLSARDARYADVAVVAPEDAGRLPAFTPGPDWAPGTITAVERPAKDRVHVRVSGSHGGWLVLHEQWARGWRATVNGASVPLLRADHAYRAVPIPPGELEVELEYAPRALEWGTALALVSLLGVLAWDLLNPGRN